MDSDKEYDVTVLFDGYSRPISGGTQANCTCTLITGRLNVIVDTMTAWDGPKIEAALHKNKVTLESIDWVVCSHGHSDHIGCNYLFKNAKHVVGFSISKRDLYVDHDFASGSELKLDTGLRILPTPGHTLQDVSVIVETKNKGTVAITGDLFENEGDLKDSSIWKMAGSDNEELQEQNRQKILKIADWIIPGHGPMFQVFKC